MKRIDREFQKFNKVYKEKLDQVIKENKLTDLFEQVDEALRRVKNEDLHAANTKTFGEINVRS